MEELYEQILIDAKLKTGQMGQKTELTRGPQRTERPTLNCSAIEEEAAAAEEEEEEEEEEEAFTVNSYVVFNPTFRRKVLAPSSG